MATIEQRIATLESLCSNRPLSKLGGAERDARITSILGYLPNAEESAVLIKKLRHELSASKGREGKNGNA